MKNQSIKVILSFSEKKTPDWFRYLSAVDSGFVRAELLRRHLKAPGAVNLWADEPTPAPLTASPDVTPSALPSPLAAEPGGIKAAPASSPAGAGVGDDDDDGLAQALAQRGPVSW